MPKSSGGLSRWFKEEWVDISRPKKGGGFEPCGRKDADEGKYPKCVPKARAMAMTQAEIDSAVKRKRRAESTERREGKKPINVSTIKKSKNIPSNPKLYAKVKAEAKRKFDVYPSAYANGWLVQEYKRRGGKYKTVTKGQPGVSDSHVPSTNWKGKYKKRRVGISALVEKGGPGSGSRPGHAFRGNQHTGGIPEGLEDRYVELRVSEIDHLRSQAGSYQQTLFGGEEKVGGFDMSLMGFGYRTKAGFVVDMDNTVTTNLEDYGVKLEEGRWGDTEYNFGEATDEQMLALASAVFNVDILTPDGRTLYRVRAINASGYRSRFEVGAIIEEINVETGEVHETRASIDRDFDFEQMLVNNNLFTLPEYMQGKGIGTTLLAHWEDQQSAIGIMQAYVHAVSRPGGMNGGYTWLRTGYEPTYPQDVAATTSVVDYIDTINRNGFSDLSVQSRILEKMVTYVESAIEQELPDLSADDRGMFAAQIVNGLESDLVMKAEDAVRTAYDRAVESTESAQDVLSFGDRLTDEIFYLSDLEFDSGYTTGYYTDSDGVEHYFPGTYVAVESNLADYARDFDTIHIEGLKSYADWTGYKEIESLRINSSSMSMLISRDAIDADGDGIIFEGTPLERSIGKPKVEKGLRGPNKPKSMHELFRWWAENDPVAWENDAPEVRASYRRLPKRTRGQQMAKGGPGSGESTGHPFRGNQHTGGIPGGKNRASYRAGGRAELGDDLGIAREVRGGGKGSDRQSSNPMTPEARANLKKIGQRISIDELAELRAAVMKTYEAMPKATKGLIDRYCRGKAAEARGGRMGGEGGRGNNAARVKRRERLMKRYGDGHTVGCVYCGIRMGYGQVEFEKLDPVMGYSMNLRGAKWPGDNDANLAPACRGCNGGLKDMSPSKKMGTKFKRKLTNAKC